MTQDKQDLASDLQNRGFLIASRQLFKFIFSFLSFFFRTELSNIDWPGYQGVFASWLCNRLRKAANHVADETQPTTISCKET